MSQMIAYGSHEPDPERSAIFTSGNFREMDKGLALRTHLFHMLFYSEVVVEQPLAPMPEQIGRILRERGEMPVLNEIQQN